jgi:hypothetical protein
VTAPGPTTRGGGSTLPVYAAFVGGLALAGSVFLPWYSVNIAPPFEAGTLSGWDATAFARVAMVLGVIIALAAGALLLADRAMVRLDAPVRLALAWAIVVAAVVAAALVGFRLVVLPDPAELLSRHVGLYVAMAAAVVAALGGLGRLATHD